MKIVNRETFLSLPAGTVFSKYSPCIFGDLCIKGDTLDHCDDFLYQGIVDEIEAGGMGEFSMRLESATQHGTELAMNFDQMGRDGCFDADQLFAVWSAVDVMKLVKRLLQACGDMFRETHHG